MTKMTVQEAVNYTNRKKDLSNTIKANTSTNVCITLLDELMRAGDYIQSVQPQLNFFAAFGAVILQEKEDFEEDLTYINKFEWLTSLETRAQELAKVTWEEQMTEQGIILESEPEVEVKPLLQLV